MRRGIVIAAALALGAMGCGSGDPGTGPGTDGGHVPGIDSGHPGVDAYMSVPRDGGSCTTDGQCAGTYCNTGNHTCCVPASPPIEICGDHIDQDCDHHDASCGDQDGDTVPACMGATPDFTMCDCDDSHADTFPALHGLPGGTEHCDGRDNDCDGTIDEAAACCTACTSLGADGASRADTCVGGGPSGSCVCSTEGAGTAPCAAGHICCSTGCVDPMTDTNNCNGCGMQCSPTNGSDHCEAGSCLCGTMGMSCACNGICMGTSCGGCH